MIYCQNYRSRKFFFVEETADVSRTAKRSKSMRGTLIIKDGVCYLFGNINLKTKEFLFRSVSVLFDHRLQ